MDLLESSHPTRSASLPPASPFKASGDKKRDHPVSGKCTLNTGRRQTLRGPSPRGASSDLTGGEPWLEKKTPMKSQVGLPWTTRKRKIPNQCWQCPSHRWLGTGQWDQELGPALSPQRLIFSRKERIHPIIELSNFPLLQLQAHHVAS